MGEALVKRWHQDYKITLREWKKHRKSHVDSNKNWRNRIGVSAYVVDCECDEQKGRFRKKDAFDCGNTRCGICHNDKFPKRSKHEHELKADLDYKEQLKELKND
jgi:hypothetical protein